MVLAPAPCKNRKERATPPPELGVGSSRMRSWLLLLEAGEALGGGGGGSLTAVEPVERPISGVVDFLSYAVVARRAVCPIGAVFAAAVGGYVRKGVRPDGAYVTAFPAGAT